MKTYKQREAERVIDLEKEAVAGLDAWEKDILEEYLSPKEEEVVKGGHKGK